MAARVDSDLAATRHCVRTSSFIAREDFEVRPISKPQTATGERIGRGRVGVGLGLVAVRRCWDARARPQRARLLGGTHLFSPRSGCAHKARRVGKPCDTKWETPYYLLVFTPAFRSDLVGPNVSLGRAVVEQNLDMHRMQLYAQCGQRPQVSCAQQGAVQLYAHSIRAACTQGRTLYAQDTRRMRRVLHACAQRAHSKRAPHTGSPSGTP